jgi:hypothetical protein
LSDQLPVQCCICRVIYKTIPAGREVKNGEMSHGYCPQCLPGVEMKWFGKKAGDKRTVDQEDKGLA